MSSEIYRYIYINYVSNITSLQFSNFRKSKTLKSWGTIKLYLEFYFLCASKMSSVSRRQKW